ncbi:DUF6624 domain-containing protein [Aquimarina rhabdastrellae]
MKDLLLIILISVNCAGFSQKAISKADSLRKKGDIEAAIIMYKKTYKVSPENKKNTYNLACAYALTYQEDSAYHYLNKALQKDNSLWALADPDLFALRKDTRWVTIEKEQIEKYQKSNGKLEEPEYTLKLLSLIQKDQALNYHIDQAKKHFIKTGVIPQWYPPLGAYKQEINKNGYEDMIALIEKYGWPKYSKVGKLAADAPLLIINHHENDAIRKKYLIQIKNACLENEGSCIEFAKIQDRILVNENQLQIYGMQFRYNAERKLEPYPIKDPEYVDKRRKKIGLESLKDYLKRKINYDWTVVQKK